MMEEEKTTDKYIVAWTDMSAYPKVIVKKTEKMEGDLGDILKKLALKRRKCLIAIQENRFKELEVVYDYGDVLNEDYSFTVTVLGQMAPYFHEHGSSDLFWRFEKLLSHYCGL